MIFSGIKIIHCLLSSRLQISSSTNYWPVWSLLKWIVDVIETADDPNKFIFYELYSDEDAVAYHNEQPYLLDVVKFVESGGMDIVIKRAVGKFMTDWI